MQTFEHTLSVERERLRLLFDALRPGVVSAEPERLLLSFTQLARCLRHCMRLEADILFPAVERAYPDQSTTRSLRGEHALIRELLLAIEDGLKSGHECGVAYDLRELEHTLELHFAKLVGALVPLVEPLLEQGDTALTTALQRGSVPS